MESVLSSKALEFIDSINNSKNHHEALLRLKIGLSDYLNVYHIAAFINEAKGFYELASTSDLRADLFNDLDELWHDLQTQYLIDKKVDALPVSLSNVTFSKPNQLDLKAFLVYTKVNDTNGFIICYYKNRALLTPKELTLVHSLLPIFRHTFLKLEYIAHTSRLLNEKTAALTVSQARFQAFAELASDWFWETDNQLRYEYISSAEDEFQAHTYQHFIGKTPIEIRSYDEQQQQKKWGMFLNFVNNHQEIHNFEYEAKAPDGKTFWISISGKAQFDEEGKYIGYMGIGRDISYAKQREIDLQKEKERAEKANAAKSDFLAVMSHEIRTPMNAILGMLELLEDTNPSSKQHELIDYMRSSTRLLQGVISDTLDFAKIESGTLKLELADTNLINLTKNLVKQFETQAIKHGIEFECTIDQSVPERIKCDGVRLSQILLNLLSNAFKFTHEGSVKLYLNKSDNQIIFRVIDTGIGISEEDISKLFEPFTQFHSRQKGRQQGVGLGLSITRRLLNLMGGSITCYSTVGEGTEFIIRVPYTSIELPDENNEYAELSNLPKTSLKVLVAEDNIANQFVIKAILEKRDYQVTIVNDGKEALTVLTNDKFDLVLMDMMMPVMDGVTAAKAIRQELYLNELPIIALTANAGLEDKEKCLEAGMNDVLTKPLDSKLLDDKIKQFLF
ncbi:ATP-binding protein [Pseudoalteromonas phenolica]|uniref:PAS domain-containing sensor histidine kinase n=1 Tax=Pseudoalteromonas phenolica TaxID=161398 RepID=UPI00384D20BE